MSGPYISKDYVIWGSLIELKEREKIWAALSKRVRTSIRKGERLGVVIRPFDEASDLEALRAITPNADDIPEVFESRHYAFVACAGETGERLGWILLAGVRGTSKLFMLCHASTVEGKQRQTPNLLIWHAVCHFLDSEYRWLDVGASYRPTLQQYFQGFRQYTYPMVLRPMDVPWRLSLRPFNVSAYGRAKGDPERARAWLSERFGGAPYTFFPSIEWARRAALQEYLDEGVTSIEERSALIKDMTYTWRGEAVEPSKHTVLLSLPEVFPVPYGAVLVGRSIPFERMWHVHGASDVGKEEETMAMMASWLEEMESWSAIRKCHAERYAKHLQMILPSSQSLAKDCLAYELSLTTGDLALVVAKGLARFGIETEVRDAVVRLPCHQLLTERHVDYIAGAVLSYFREGCGVPH